MKLNDLDESVLNDIEQGIVGHTQTFRALEGIKIERVMDNRVMLSSIHNDRIVSILDRPDDTGFYVMRGFVGNPATESPVVAMTFDEAKDISVEFLTPDQEYF